MHPRTGTSTCDCTRADHQHGTYGMYSKHRCGCLPCRLRCHELRQQHRSGTGGLGEDQFIDRLGTIRRLEALHRIGWTTPLIAERLGVSRQTVLYWRTYPGPILRHTAERVVSLYASLSMKPAPRTRGTAITINSAIRAGWAPPLAWDDDTIDDPDATPAGLVETDVVIDQFAIDLVLQGNPISLTWHERRELRRQALADGMSGDRITDLLRGVTIRTGTASRPVQERHRRTTEPEPCGTYAAYRRHLRNGEPPDQDCKNAHAAARAGQRHPDREETAA